jgi:hypothetical protein
MAGQTTNYLFDYPTSTDYVKDGATAIETLADDVDATLFTALGGAYPGLRLIKKQTVGTAVSTVSVTSAFSATYDNYLILWTGALGSANGSGIFLKFNNSAGSTYNYFGNFGTYGAATLTSTNAAATNDGILATLNSTVANSLNVELAVRNPFATSVTTASTRSSGSVYAFQVQGYDSNSASQTGFSFTVPGATFTGGTIYVYGYGIS